MPDKPLMPVDELIELICDVGSYCDGDNPGWGSVSYDATTGILTLGYEPDDEAEPQFAGPYRATIRRFREIDQEAGS